MQRSKDIDGEWCPYHSVCPVVCNIKPCNETLCYGGIDERGCKRKDICIPRETNKFGDFCPGMCPPICSDDEIFCHGPNPSQWPRGQGFQTPPPSRRQNGQKALEGSGTTANRPKHISKCGKLHTTECGWILTGGPTTSFGFSPIFFGSQMVLFGKHGNTHLFCSFNNSTLSIETFFPFLSLNSSMFW